MFHCCDPTDLPLENIKKCIGDPDADVENQVLKTEQELQVYTSCFLFLCFVSLLKYKFPFLFFIRTPHVFSSCSLSFSH